MPETKQTVNIPNRKSNELSRKQLERILAVAGATPDERRPRWRQAGQVLGDCLREKRYEENHDSFTDFCRSLGLSVSQAYILIAAAQVASELEQWAREDGYTSKYEQQVLSLVGITQRDVREVAIRLGGETEVPLDRLTQAVIEVKGTQHRATDSALAA